VLIHQRSKGATQALFKRNRGRVAAAAFHPSRPLLFVATQRHVYVYNLAKQALAKKLQAGSGPLTSLAIHPRGDNLLVGSADKKCAWFDLDLGARPYKTFASHGASVTSVAFHPRYPLFASGGDDATAHVFHGRVYDDLATNALIVPLKVLRGHSVEAHAGVQALAWHPSQPWLATAGADGTARLWVNL
jgi:ribosome biogenesis protein ERB1